MAQEKLVESVNANVKALRDDAVGQREHPRLIALMDEMIRLTNSDEDNAALDAAQTAITQDQAQPSDAEILAAFRSGKIKAV